MMSSSNSSSCSGRNQIQFYGSSSPFTASQYEELEHQALIYKYIVSGVPIPSHLLPSVRPTSLDFSSALFSNPTQPTVGWGCFQVGYGNKKIDPEPGRCRRTDGKKWRCSKEAYPDSKYCEKHMHRGKNRSKNKPFNLEVLISNTSTTTSTITPTSSSSSSTPSISPVSPNYSIPTISDYTNAYTNYLQASGNYYQNNSLYPFLSPHSSITAAPSSGFSGQDRVAHHLLLGSSSGNMGDKHSRYWRGVKEDSGEKSFFPEALRTTMKGVAYDSYAASSAIPLTMSSPSEYSHVQHHHHQPYNIITDEHTIREGDDQGQHELEDNASNSRGTNNNGKNPFHHFFSEWPAKNTTDSWLDDDGQEDRDPSHHHQTVSASTTQLSISIPPHSF